MEPDAAGPANEPDPVTDPDPTPELCMVRGCDKPWTAEVVTGALDCVPVPLCGQHSDRAIGLEPDDLKEHPWRRRVEEAEAHAERVAVFEEILEADFEYLPPDVRWQLADRLAGV